MSAFEKWWKSVNEFHEPETVDIARAAWNAAVEACERTLDETASCQCCDKTAYEIRKLKADG